MKEAKKIEIRKDELPEGWIASSLGDIASYVQRGKSPKYIEFSELPVINQKCVRWHGIERQHVKYIHPDQFEKWEEKRFLQNGDLLWNSTGTGTIGRAAIVHLKEGEKLVADSHVTIVRSGDGIEPKYVHYWVMSPAVQNSIEAMQSGSTNQVELSKGAVESTPIPLAPPEQQKRIVAKIEELFSHIDAGIEALKKAKQLLKQYRQSVLKAAVIGELTKDLPSRQAGWRDTRFRNISGKRVPESSPVSPAGRDKYFAYVLECEDGSLYKGFCKDLFQRIDQHLTAQGAKWTREHKPVSIIHFEEFDTEKEAVEREKYFKSGSGREWLNQVREEQNKKYEPATQLLERILKERRQKWEEQQLEQFKAKGKMPKDDKWKEKYKEPLTPEFEHVHNIPEIPETWEWVTVSQLTTFVKDGPHYSPKYAEKGIPFITGGNVRPNGVDFESCKYITQELHEELSKRCKPELYDILYTKGGTTGIARVNTYDFEFNVWVHVAVLRLIDTSMVEPFFVQHALNSLLCYVQSQKYTHGVGNQDLGLTRMVKISLALPPIEEQSEIIEVIDRKMESIDRIEEQVDHMLVMGEKNKQSVLASAFSGNLKG